MFGGMNLKLAAASLILSVTFAAGWAINGWRWESKAFKNEQKQIKQAEDAQKLAAEYELLKQSKDAKQNVITKEIYVETSKPAYDCRIPESGMLIIRNAIETANSSKSN